MIKVSIVFSRRFYYFSDTIEHLKIVITSEALDNNHGERISIVNGDMRWLMLPVKANMKRGTPLLLLIQSPWGH